MERMEIEQRRLTQLHPLRRNRFYYGKLMGVLQFVTEQERSMAQQMLFDRLALGSGVVCGLKVVPIRSGDIDGVRVSAGMAIDGWGRFIIVPRDHDIVPLAATDECGQPLTGIDPRFPIRIELCYDECLADYAPALVVDASCDDRRSCEPGTWVESYCLRVTEGAGPTLPDHSCSSEIVGHLAAGRVHQAMGALLQECGSEPSDPCIVLANIERATDGALTIIEDTAPAVVPTNRILLDLISCLARRVEECCSAGPTPTPTPAPTPTPTPTPTPPPGRLLRVVGVNLYLLREGSPTTTVRPVARMLAPITPLRVVGRLVDTIEVMLELPLRPEVASVIAQQTFIVVGRPASLPVLNPQIFYVPSTNAVRFFVARPLLPGAYTVRLTDAVVATTGSRLDGEFPTTTQWPSGDGNPGGDFEFVLEIT